MKSIYIVFFFVLMFVQNAWSDSNKKTVLLSSCVCQKPEILKEFLLGISELNKDEISLSILFLDDNYYSESSELLSEFQSKSPIPCQTIKISRDYLTPIYHCDENQHHWTLDLMWRLAKLKNQILDKARDGQYDFLFMVDSDVVIHPNTLQQLIQSNKPIVCNLYWTEEIKNSSSKPQVWLTDYDTRFQRGDREEITPEEACKRENEFFQKLNIPGTYEVGGVAGCLLIRKDALQQKISFSRLKNLTYPDEDRYFSIRASALGIKLFVDTHYPALHVYRESDLEKIKDYKNYR